MEQKFNYYDLGPRIVNSKPKYREPEQNNKLTYNFVTDPRLKRGHNFGVVYVTSSNFEEESKLQNNLNNGQRRLAKPFASKQERNRKDQGDRLKYDMKSGFGVCTEKVVTTVRPKPITFEVVVQTDPLPPKEQEKLIWPEKTGIDVETQVEDGDLFNFDEEVLPLVRIIVGKTIEDSRREVLEEEERKEIQEQQRKYNELFQAERERVNAIENKERELFEEKKRRKEEKAKRVELTKLFQKKLTCRMLAKKYLGQIDSLRNNAVHMLSQRGMFKHPEVDDYFTELLPEIQSIAEQKANDDHRITNALDEYFHDQHKLTSIQTNQKAKANEKETQRQAKERRRKLKEDIELEKKRKEEEERQKVISKIHKIICDKLFDELFKSTKFEESLPQIEIYDVNGYYQKGGEEGFVTCTGGPIGQMALVLSAIDKEMPDLLTEEDLPKIIDTYLPHSHTFSFLYSAEDVEEYKEIFEEITEIEDIVNSENEQFDKILQKLYDKAKEHDDVLPMVFDIANELGLANVESYFKRIFTYLLMKFKEGTKESDCVQFLKRDPAWDKEIQVSAICLINAEKIQVPPVEETVAAKPKFPNLNKANVIVVKEFKHFISEKALLMRTITDNVKIYAVNKNFEHVFRMNFINCIDSVVKRLKPDDKVHSPEENEELNQKLNDVMKMCEMVSNGLLLKLVKMIGKEKIGAVEVKIESPDKREEEEEEREDEEK